MMIRVTYEDGTHREVELAEVSFGDDETRVRGNVVSVTPLTVRDDGIGGPGAMRTRSIARRAA